MKLGKGINIGGYLSQCEHTDAHYESFINETDIRTIAEWGFDHVRVPVDYIVLEDVEGKKKIKGYEILGRLAGWCRQNCLDMIIDLHKAYGYDFNNAGDDEQNCLFSSGELQNRFISLWQEIAASFGNLEHVAFELLNEIVETEYAEPWNVLIDECVAAIRRITAETVIIYGGVQWNSAQTVKLLERPKYRNILFSFHFYEPMAFTHQNAYWVPELKTGEIIKYPETMAYYRKKSEPLGTRAEHILNSERSQMGSMFLEDLLEDAFKAAENMGVGLYCGEYGVIDQAPRDDTLRWFQDINAVLEKHGVGYCVWNYKSKDFGLFDSHYDGIRGELFGDKGAVKINPVKVGGQNDKEK